jgi:hypothetical protein
MPHRSRLPIHSDERGAWNLVVATGRLFVEFAGPSGVRRFTLEQFEASPDGQRIANSLTVALARAPQG